MILSQTSIRRPVLASVMSLVLILLGLVAGTLIQVRQFPAVDPPVVTVTSFFRGAPAEVVDADVTKRIVDAMTGLEKVRYIDAVSSQQNSRITIEFEVGRDLDLAAASVQSRLSRVRAELPENLDEPVIEKASADADPIFWIGLASDELTALEINDFAERVLVDQLETVSGVSRVFVGGERRYAVRIWLDRRAMAGQGVTVADIARRLRQENIEVPSGRIESAARELTVRTQSRFDSLEQFRRMVIRDDAQAGRVRLSDVARVELGAESYRTLLRKNGEQAIGLGIVRQSDANSLQVVNEVRRLLPRLRRQLPESVSMEVNYDASKFIRQSIQQVVQTLLIAIGLVVLVMLAFLGSLRAMLVPAVAIPVSIIGPVFVMFLAGFSLNVLTLLAGVLAIGLVVDDTVVVLENIARRRELGEPTLLAASRGVDEVSFAVIATTAVLVAVFVPLAFLTGRVGRLFVEFGITLSAMVICSSFVALTLGPMMASKLLDRKAQPQPESESQSESEPNANANANSKTLRQASGDARDPAEGRQGIGRKLGRLGGRAKAVYERAVAVAIRRRWITLAIAAVVAALAVALFRGLPSTLAPPEDQGVFFVIVEGPEGASVEYTLEQVKQIEDVIARQDERWRAIEDQLSLIPFFGGNPAVNEAVVICVLKPWADRDITQQQIVMELFPKLLALPGAKAIPVNPPSLGLETTNQPVQFVVQALDFPTAFEVSERIKAQGEQSGLFRNLSSDYRPTRPELRIAIDRDRATELGVDARAMGQAMQAFLGGLEATEYFDQGELYEVILEGEDPQTARPQDLENIYVRGRGDELIALKNLVSLEEGGTPRTLRRFNKLPSVVLSGSPLPGVSLGQALGKLEAIAENELPQTASVGYLGRSLEFQTTSYRLYIVFGLSLLIVYLVLAAQFESWVDPLTVMVAVPLAVTGGLLGLALTGTTINIFSQIGMILLIGLVAKNGILLVEFANQLRERDHDVSPIEAAKQAAAIRLRPILMTAISTILGALPLALATGAGANGRRAIGVTVIGGMLLASILTLLVIPALYSLMAKLSKPKNIVHQRLEQQHREHEGSAVEA